MSLHFFPPVSYVTVTQFPPHSPPPPPSSKRSLRILSHSFRIGSRRSINISIIRQTEWWLTWRKIYFIISGSEDAHPRVHVSLSLSLARSTQFSSALSLEAPRNKDFLLFALVSRSKAGSLGKSVYCSKLYLITRLFFDGMHFIFFFEPDIQAKYKIMLYYTLVNCKIYLENMNISYFW